MSCETITFYNQDWCPTSQSIHLALEASKVPHVTIDVDNNAKQHSCSETANEMPYLVKNGETSIRNYREAITYLKLFAEDPAVRSKQEKVLNDFAIHILPFFEKAVILKSPREGLDLFIEALAFLENDLIFSGGRYFGGEQPNVVDYGIFPYLDKIGKWMNQLEPKDCPRIQTWVRAMREHPLVAKIFSNHYQNEHFETYSASLANKKIVQ